MQKGFVKITVTNGFNEDAPFKPDVMAGYMSDLAEHLKQSGMMIDAAFSDKPLAVEIDIKRTRLYLRFSEATENPDPTKIQQVGFFLSDAPRHALALYRNVYIQQIMDETLAEELDPTRRKWHNEVADQLVTKAKNNGVTFLNEDEIRAFMRDASYLMVATTADIKAAYRAVQHRGPQKPMPGHGAVSKPKREP